MRLQSAPRRLSKCFYLGHRRGLLVAGSRWTAAPERPAPGGVHRFHPRDSHSARRAMAYVSSRGLRRVVGGRPEGVVRPVPTCHRVFAACHRPRRSEVEPRAIDMPIRTFGSERSAAVIGRHSPRSHDWWKPEFLCGGIRENPGPISPSYVHFKGFEFPRTLPTHSPGQVVADFGISSPLVSISTCQPAFAMRSSSGH